MLVSLKMQAFLNGIKPKYSYIVVKYEEIMKETNLDPIKKVLPRRNLMTSYIHGHR